MSGAPGLNESAVTSSTDEHPAVVSTRRQLLLALPRPPTAGQHSPARGSTSRTELTFEPVPDHPNR
jgi:hypothetical protein